MLVIDVSKWQKDIDFASVAKAGVKGVIVRAGYGYGTTDEYFKRNIEGALMNGLQVGVYWFMYCQNNKQARANAETCLNLIEPYKKQITLGVWSDWEYDSDKKAPNQTKISRTEYVRIFNQLVEDEGYMAGTYLNNDYYKNYFDMSVLNKWAIWLADYSGECDHPCTMRQYTSKGSISGISGNVDLNEWFGMPKICKEVATVNIKLRILRKGDKGEEVKTVQRLLNAIGYKGLNGKALAIDGDFGTNTDYAVGNFQQMEGLVRDSIVGAKTWEHLLK